MRDLVYISYSHRDKEWHSRLRQVLDRDSRLRVWDDTKIPTGSSWSKVIHEHVARARIMVMLVSEDYLAPTCSAADCEITPTLEAAAQDEVTIFPIPVGRSPYAESSLKHIMAALDPSRPLEEMAGEEQQAALEGVYHQILRILSLDPRDFDVFLSHNSKDKAAVRQLAQNLRVRGLKVWLDEWELPPACRWQEEIEGIIKATQSAAVLVGRDGVGPWEEPEMRACLNQYVDRKLRVIPVLLPGAPQKPELPLFLRDFSWVDFREGLTREGLNRLEWGITGKKPDEKIERLAERVQELGDKSEQLKNEVRQQESDLQAIRVALRGIVTKWEIDYLRKLTRAGKWDCRWDQDTFNRLKRLDEMGFVLPTAIDGERSFERFRKLFQSEKPVDERPWFDMKNYWEITEDGKKYVKLYDIT